MSRLVLILSIAAACAAPALPAAEPFDIRADMDALKKELASLREKVGSITPVSVRTADALVENRYGPNATVTAKQGKLTLGGLWQVWLYSIQNDNLNWVDANALRGGAFGSNEATDNDGFRIRRVRLMFTMDITENVLAFVMINAAGDAASYPPLPATQMYYTSGAFINPGFDAKGAPIGSPRNAVTRSGGGTASRLLEEAWIRYHGVIPHHDFQLGTIIRPIGEEGPRSSGLLDFVERAMINQNQCIPAVGGHLHGTWWDDRLQYWLGAYDGAGPGFAPRYNRSDDNDDKDFLGKILVRPVWKDEKWGSLELGYSLVYGYGGEAGGHWFGAYRVDGLNFPRTVHVNQHAWASYMPGGPVRGWWLRGEFGQYRDRLPAKALASYPPALDVVVNPAPFNIYGWYFATGYKLSESIWAGKLSKYLKPAEFTFRYDVMENLLFADLVYPSRRFDEFKTQVYTAGLNYYIRGHNAKIQVNYNWVNEEAPDESWRQVREVRNDNLMVNFQIMY